MMIKLSNHLFTTAMSAALFATTFTAATALTTPSAEAAQPIEVYAELPRTSQVRISPNGKRVAMVAPYETGKAVFVYNLQNPDDVKIVPPAAGALLKDIRWGSDTHIIMRNQFRRADGSAKQKRFGREYSRYISSNVDTGEQVILFKDKIFENQKNNAGSRSRSRAVGSSQAGSISHPLPDDAEHVLMDWREYVGKAVRRQYKVNLDTGRETLVRTMPIEASSVIMSADGSRVLARADYDDRANTYEVYVGDGLEGGAKPIFTRSIPKDENPVWNLVTVLDDGKILMIEGEKEELTLFTVDPRTGATSPYRPTFDTAIPDGYDYFPVFDPFSRKLIGVTWTDDFYNIDYIAEPYKSWARKARKTFKGKRVTIASRTRDNSAVTLAVAGKGEPTNYYLYEPKKGQVSALGGTYPEIGAQDLARTERVNYAARDGLNIPGYLTLPPGKTKADGPFSLVAMPHGGPIGPRDDGEFDWWSQYLAAQGYAVFKPQFRGSGGFGYSFEKAGYGEFGGAMLTDTIDGINKLVADGVVNKDKICVTGGSYGGYQAFALPMIEPDMFKCAVALNGVSDINAIMQYEIERGGRNGSPIKFWERVIGDYNQDKDRIASESPANRISDIKAEIVIVHGEDDMTVPYEQAKIMSKALKKAGRNGDILVLKNDDHFLSHAKSRKQLLEASDALFAKHLK